MNYLEALDQLDAIGQKFASSADLPTGFRLHVRPRGQSHPSSLVSDVQLQHHEGAPEHRFWYDVGHVNVSLGAISIRGQGLELVTYINCTMCGRWEDNCERAVGLKVLFDIASAFAEFASGQVFDP